MNNQLSQTKANKQLIREYLTEILISDGDRRDEFLTEDHVQHGPAPYQEFSGSDASWEYAASLRRAFPDLEYSIIDLMAMRDHVLVNFMAHGTQDGDLVLGDTVFEPTGKEATWKNTASYRIVNGKIAETQLKFGKASLVRQLGISFPSMSVEPATKAEQIDTLREQKGALEARLSACNEQIAALGGGTGST